MGKNVKLLGWDYYRSGRVWKFGLDESIRDINIT